MYRLCIGYVSVMYRLCIGANKKKDRNTCIFESFVLSLQQITVVFAQKMNWQTALYRIGSYLKHCLTARNTGGHGIHSPYLFELVRMVLHDENVYYAWDKIEEVRERMLADEREVEFVDYGSGKRRLGDEAKDNRLVKNIAKGSLAKKKYAQTMARLVNWLGTSRSLNIVELGTSLGVTTAYLAAVDSRNKVVTYEGCPAVAEIAKENWKTLGLSNIECVVGEITVDSLQITVDGSRGIDVAFIDANHTHAGTRAYFNVLAEKMHEKSVMIVDDIHYNEEMDKAWQEICEDKRVTSTMDLYQMGLVFFDKNYWRKNYKIRL